MQTDSRSKTLLRNWIVDLGTIHGWGMDTDAAVLQEAMPAVPKQITNQNIGVTLGANVLFISKNLIGDALNIYPALRRFHLTNPDAHIDLYTLPDHTKSLYGYMGVPVNVITELPFDIDKINYGLDWDETGYDTIFEFSPNTAFILGDRHKAHIALCYANMLGVKLEQEDWELKFNPPPVELADNEKGLFLISPFSKSCSSNEGKPPNKMLPWEKWRPIITVLRSMGKIGMLGGPTDRAMELGLAEDEYFTGLPLERVAHIIRASRLVVTIDNGIAHLAASQKAKMVLFYPACLGLHWIIPIGNPNMLQVIQMDPSKVDVSELVLAVKRKILQGHL